VSRSDGALWFSVPSESNQRSGPVGAQARDDVNRIAAYLARRDVASLSPVVVPRADVLVLCGSAVLASIGIAATAFQVGLADRLLVSGGIGHSTPHLRQAVRENPRYGDVPTDARPESAIIAEILRTHHAVPDAAILIEDESVNDLGQRQTTKASDRTRRSPVSVSVSRSGYGTTKGCGEWWPHAPLTVPLIAMVDGRKRPDLMMSALISNVPSTVGAVARAVQSMRDPRGVCRVRRRRTTRDAQPAG
jgi:hypothetical protein